MPRETKAAQAEKEILERTAPAGKIVYRAAKEKMSGLFNVGRLWAIVPAMNLAGEFAFIRLLARSSIFNDSKGIA